MFAPGAAGTEPAPGGGDGGDATPATKRRGEALHGMAYVRLFAKPWAHNTTQEQSKA